MSNDHQSGGLGDQIRTGLKGIHGAGEVIRGAAMKAADDVFDTMQDNSKNQAIVDKGLSDVKRADEMVGHEHGVHSKTQHIAPSTGVGAGTTVQQDVQAAGAHATAPGNIGVGGLYGATGPQTGNMNAVNVNMPQEQMGTSQRF